MAAFWTVRLFNQRAVRPVAAFATVPRVIRRRSIDFSAILKMILRAGRDWLLFLWMLAAAALCVVIAAGSVGLLR